MKMKKKLFLKHEFESNIALIQFRKSVFSIRLRQVTQYEFDNLTATNRVKWKKKKKKNRTIQNIIEK